MNRDTETPGREATTETPVQRVLIIQEHMPAFRVPFYERLRDLLAGQGVDLQLVYAPNQRNTFLKGQLAWAEPVPIRWFGPLGWQPVLNLCRRKDLVIIQQETKYAVNPILQAWSACGGPKVAYWGHGKNFQKTAESGVSGFFKKFLAKRVDWWFAYNNLSAKVVADFGFPTERITSVGNAVDTTGMRKRLKELSPENITALRESHGIRSENVAVYTGGLYPNKRIGFLLEAAMLIRDSIPDFELIFIGDGPQRAQVKEAAAKESWIHDIGPMDDHGKVPYWAMAKLLLMPGLVGLVVVDSFALGVPLVTTDYPFHSPEIDYLKDGENGSIVHCGDDAAPYANAVVELLRKPERIAVLKDGAVRSAEQHTIETMATSFADGVMRCLGRA
jgi:glycosyltransferase involved in cell wall biosynthesis